MPARHEPDNKQTRDLEKGETLMASSSSAPEDEGFGFFTDEYDVPAAANSEAKVIDLGPMLTIKNIEEWHSRLENSLGESNNVRL